MLVHLPAGNHRADTVADALAAAVMEGCWPGVVER